LQQRFRFYEAVLPLVTATALLVWTVAHQSTSFHWPLAAGALVAAGLAYRAGYGIDRLARAALGGMRSTLVALYILVLVGGLIGVWKASGTVPAMVYYGLGLVSPRFLVPAAFMLALVVSMMLGTYVGTLSTVGVAVMGVAHGVGAPLPLVAGALVSGALVGDRSSPLSGSLNLNVAMTGTEMRRVLRTLAPTVGLAALASLVIYGWWGSWFATGAGGLSLADEGAAGALRAALGMHFAIHPALLIPPVMVLALAFGRVPVKWALVAGMLTSLLNAVALGHSWKLPLQAGLFGYVANVGDPALNRILSGGGILPMAKQVLLILVAGSMNGIMEETGMIGVVIDRLVDGVKGEIGLYASGMGISVAVAMVAANQSLSIIVPGRVLRMAFRRVGLSEEKLSRAVADSGTVMAGIIPWNIMAMTASAALGIPVHTFAPYALLAWVLPVISVAWAAMERRGSPWSLGRGDEAPAIAPGD
jgi:NhaC family Na+:H+ antiporter